MSRAKKEPERCKALTKKTGRRCTLKCDNTGYCKTHREAVTRAGGKNSHKIYSTYYTKEEILAAVGIDEAGQAPNLVTLIREIVAARIIVRRAFAEWTKWAETEGADQLEDGVVEASERSVVTEQTTILKKVTPRKKKGQEGAKSEAPISVATPAEVTKETIRRTRPDLWTIIDRALGRVGSLVEKEARVMEVKELEEQLGQLNERLAEMGKA